MLNCDTVLANTPNIEKVSKVVVSLSGGLDSTVLLHLMVRKFGASNVFAISFDYQQRHDVELQLAKKTCRLLGVEHTIVDISFLGKMAAGVSAMVKGDVATPTIHDVLGDPQPATYMPNRNMILASISAAFAETKGCDGIALGITGVDAFSYWDTSPDFYEAISNVLKLNRKNPCVLITPLLHFEKQETIKLGSEVGVRFQDTWSCYNPIFEDASYQICKVCPACMTRKSGFEKAGIADSLVSN